MNDIVDRLRGQEPLHLGDRSAAADVIERLRAENEALNSACAVGVRWNDLLADRLARNQSKRKAK